MCNLDIIYPCNISIFLNPSKQVVRPIRRTGCFKTFNFKNSNFPHYVQIQHQNTFNEWIQTSPVLIQYFSRKPFALKKKEKYFHVIQMIFNHCIVILDILNHNKHTHSHIHTHIQRYLEMLTLSTQMSSADDRPYLSTIFSQFPKIQIFIAIFGFSMENAIKWEQMSLVLVQWFCWFWN